MGAMSKEEGAMQAVMAPSELLLDTNPEYVTAQVEVACRLHDAAVAAYDTGRADAAEALFRQALAMFEHSEGGEHPDVAAVLGDLGAVYEERCEYTAAPWPCWKPPWARSIRTSSSVAR